jgi:hypothetical protein
MSIVRVPDKLPSTAQEILGTIGSRLQHQHGGPDESDIRRLHEIYEVHGLTLDLARRVGRSPAWLCKWFKRYGLWARPRSSWTGGAPRRVSIDNPDAFGKIDTPRTAYLAGFLFADGKPLPEKGIELAVALPDIEIVRMLKTHLGTAASVRTKGNTASLVVTHVGLCRDLFQHGVQRNRMLNDVPFPQLLQDMVRHFVRGFLDGDGSISRKRSIIDGLAGWCVTFAASPAVAACLCNYCQGLGLKKPLTRTVGSILQVCVTGPWVHLLLMELYHIGDDALPRKSRLVHALIQAARAAYPDGLNKSLHESGNALKRRTMLPDLGRCDSADARHLARRAVKIWEECTQPKVRVSRRGSRRGARTTLRRVRRTRCGATRNVRRASARASQPMHLRHKP